MGIHVLMTIVRAIKNFFHKSPAGNITIGDAVTKGVNALNDVIAKWDLYKPEIEDLISEEGSASIEQVETEIKSAIEKFKDVNTFPDLSVKLVDVKLADDPKRNDFYHSLLQQAALAGDDGNISVPELLLMVGTAISFFKGN